jgi:hypothetical protein
VGITLAALAVGGCSAAGTHDPSGSLASKRSVPSQLRSALVQEAPQGFQYTLTSLSSCKIGDALTILANTARSPAKITGLKLDVAHDPTGLDQTIYKVAAIVAGSNPGELANSFSLEILRGVQLRSAVGAELSPVATSGKYYEFAAFVRVRGTHPTRWQISGLTVSFTLGGHSFSTDFGQDVRLAATRGCAT